VRIRRNVKLGNCDKPGIGGTYLISAVQCSACKTSIPRAAHTRTSKSSNQGGNSILADNVAAVMFVDYFICTNLCLYWGRGGTVARSSMHRLQCSSAALENKEQNLNSQLVL